MCIKIKCTPTGNFYRVEEPARGNQRFLSYFPCEYELVFKKKTKQNKTLAWDHLISKKK